MADMDFEELDDDQNLPSSSPVRELEDPQLEKFRPVIYEFVHLLEKSKELFNRLRELPKYSQKIWQPYFARTFEVYTNLWKWQQQHRDILEKMYGLKRWQIGEIASRIGQLYYQYYLRTGEANYLFESYSFYSAIKLRAYYAKSKKEEKPDVMVKKLRYFARYIVVCLLLRKMSVLHELVQELSRHVEDYKNVYKQPDVNQWAAVVHEIRDFVTAEDMVTVTDTDGSTLALAHRLSPATPPHLTRPIPMHHALEDILIVGTTTHQVKFSELSMDMYRMLQVLEYEPQEDKIVKHHEAAAATAANPGDLSREMQTPSAASSKAETKARNPHKYLLYKPSLAQLLSYLATSFSELPQSGVLLIYLSSDDELDTPDHPPLSALSEMAPEDSGLGAFDKEGVKMARKQEREGGPRRDRRGRAPRDIGRLYPGDLLTYTRKPLFLVVDAPQAFSFSSLSKAFSQPLVVLMSATEVPSFIADIEHQGRLMTLFLSDPTTAFLVVCGLDVIPRDDWETCQGVTERYLNEACKLVTTSSSLPSDYMVFMGDPFLRVLLLRFMFHCTCLSMHRSFKGQSFLPSAQPALPEDDLLHHPTLQLCIRELSSILDKSSLFVSSLSTMAASNV